MNQFGTGFGWTTTAEATSGSQENIRRLDSGELDLAMSNAAITYFAARGGEGWNKAYPVRAVMTLAPNVALFISPAGSGIESIDDLVGRYRTYTAAGGREIVLVLEEEQVSAIPEPVPLGHANMNMN